MLDPIEKDPEKWLYNQEYIGFEFIWNVVSCQGSYFTIKYSVWYNFFKNDESIKLGSWKNFLWWIIFISQQSAKL